jgi:exopolyphosphatase/guanosine-5'-triphosphate,3'-diphosphate pyrophosphatase
MTSAVRDAANGRRFADDVSSRFGLDVHVISGDEEAHLTYLGATDQRDGSEDAEPTLVFDIGGGSTELVIGHGDRLDFHVSTQAGVVRQADRHITSDPPTRDELNAVAQDVRATLDQAVPAEYRSRPGRALGVAGTPTSLAAIAQDLDPYDPEKVHGYSLSAEKRDEIFKRLAAMPLEQRRHVKGLHPDRAIAILPGIVILTEIMNLFALDAVEVSEHDILRGAALHYAKSYPQSLTSGASVELDGPMTDETEVVVHAGPAPPTAEGGSDEGAGEPREAAPEQPPNPIRRLPRDPVEILLTSPTQLYDPDQRSHLVQAISQQGATHVRVLVAESIPMNSELIQEMRLLGAESGVSRIDVHEHREI